MKRNILSRPESEEVGLPGASMYRFTMNRRRFFQVMGSGVAVALSASKATAGIFSHEGITPEDQVAAWIHINEKGQVTVFTGKAEVGQNIRTSLAQAVAEELHVPMERISMIMGDTDLTPYDRGTFGSRSTPYMGPQLRRAAATAREILLDTAAQQWKCERKGITIRDGVVRHDATRNAADIGELSRGKKLLKAVNDNVALTPAASWKVAGTSIPKVNGRSFITGGHKYVSDMKVPEMLYGKVLRPPAYGAALKSLDLSAVERMKDVVVVRDGNFVGVAAPDPYTAMNAIAAMRATWETISQPGREEIFEHLKKRGQEGNADESSGDVQTAFAKSPIRIDRTINVDYIAHAPLEPRAGLAQWKDGRLTVWTGTQRPFGVQEELAEVFSMPKEKIRVIMPDTGSGYGGKHTGEAGIEAARLAREAGKPVKVVWTREEEFTWAYFRPAGVIEVKAGAEKSGLLTSWEFHNYNSGGSGIHTPYEVLDKTVSFHPSDSPLRQGSYRALAATANTFAREVVMDDLALESGMDPLAFRIKNLGEQRMIDVLNAAAEKFGWVSYRQSPDHGRGIACGTEKGGFVATCVEVAVDRRNNAVRVLRAVTAFECGAIINPGHLEHQVEGAVVQGLGGALFEWIDFKNGKILNAAFSAYRVPRFADMPKLETVMLDRKDLPSAGAGEAPILAIAPAIRNAIAHASGKRLYSLPLVPHGLKLS